MIPILHPFQEDLYHRVRARRAEGKRIIVVQGATGCGKNTWSAFVVKQASLKSTDVLCMVHRRKLVNQISDRLIQFEVNHGVFMRGEPRDHGARIQVASRDTLLSRCVRNEWIGMPPAQLIVVDEAHHAAHPDSEYRRILACYPQATILLLSASPVGPDGKGLGPWAQAIECALPTSQLVKQGYLVPVKWYAPDRKKKGRKFLRGIAGDLVESWKTYAEGLPTVLFCSRVANSQAAVQAFQEAGLTFVHVDADTPDDVRERAFDDVANGRINGISNVGIIGEGVDVPELSCVQLWQECGSRVGFLQRCGRIMRPAPGKKYGIGIDHSGAVFRHGFPDEDTEWTLEGNADEAFAKKHKAGETEKAFYCKQCELAYHGTEFCPQCGRKPVKPPRSVFAPVMVDSTDELLIEAERNGTGVFSDESKIEHWKRCLAIAAHRGGPFTMASAMWKRKYGDWPPDDYPMMPGWDKRRMKVTDVYPGFGKRKAPASTGERIRSLPQTEDKE